MAEPQPRRRLHSTLSYAAALAVSSLVLACLLKLWQADLSIPFQYGGDSPFTSMWIKGIHDNGWYLSNPYLGMPTGLEMHDFPMAENFHFLVIKLIDLVAGDWAVALNLYFVLTFPATTWTALYVLRRFGVSYLPALLGSLLFTFLPYHWYRGVAHLFLAAYYLIPLMVLLIVRVYHGEVVLFQSGRASGAPRPRWLAGRTLGSLAVCFLVASTGVYYAVFFCYFLLIAGVAAFCRKRQVHLLCSSAMLACVVLCGLALNALPTFIYRFQHGGLGSIAAIALTASIRSYNRMSVFIAFFSLSAFCLLLDSLYQRAYPSIKLRRLFQIGIAVLVAAGILDQTPKRILPSSATSEEYGRDAAFIHAIEAVLPAHAMVFQLPYMVFPEAIDRHGSVFYDHFRAYLHSRTLRWSFGAMRGREGDAWQRDLVSRQPEEQVKYLAAAGFAGVLIDRSPRLNSASGVEAVLSYLPGTAPLASSDNRWCFYDLRPYRTHLQQTCSASQWSSLCEAVRHPVIVTWHEGFSDPDGVPPDQLHWCAAKGEFRIHNLGNRSRKATLRMCCVSGTPGPALLRLHSHLFSTLIQISQQGCWLEQDLVIPPGTHSIRLVSDGKRVVAPGDLRDLVFFVKHVSVNESEEPAPW
jgi:hypothetical protein